MDFQVLGPVTGYEGEAAVELGGPKQRLVLAMLLAARGSTVSTDALMDGLWRESLPATARKTLQGYVHHLRSKIGEALRTDKAGYSLHVPDTLVDERRFGTTVTDARHLLDIDPAAASEQLSGALALWRGNPYADVDDAPALLPEITRLTESRQVALGDRIDADLALGRHETLIGELESLTVEYSLQERFRAQHMLALYRSGRHGEALRAYARTRDLLIEEMGIEPSVQLAELEERILARDDALDLVPEPLPATTIGASRALRGYELREEVEVDDSGTLYRGYQRSVGREVAVRVRNEEFANDPLFIARYEADVTRVANLDHPNIVFVHDTWREPGLVCQVMQWIEGERLDAHLATHRPSQWAALKVIEQVGAALGVAHNAGVVHGDLSAHSVLVDRSGDAHLTDFVIGRAPGDESDDRVALARLAYTALFGVAPPMNGDPFPILGSPDVRPELHNIFEIALTGCGYAGPEDFVLALRRALGGDVVELAAEATPTRSDIRCPYKGLHAFQTADSDDFFGRDDLVDRLFGLLISQRCVTVVGPSGSGKSSLVKAGLVARLNAEGGRRLIAEMYPGAYPFDALEDAVRSIAVRDDAISDRLLADERGLLRVLESVLPEDGTELILVIDQFEELFAMVASESVRALFLAGLTAAVTDPASRLRLVLTLRADFFDRPLRYAEFGAAVEHGLMAVTMPDDTQLAAAIERPAAAVGLGLEPGLVAEIIRDVADEPGSLPLLQYVLTELFERRTGDLLTLESYRASGGVLGALGARAEGLYTDMSPAGQRAIHQAFLRLVTVDESADNVRRRVGRADLAALEVDAMALEDGLRRFGAHRLLTFDADRVSRAPTVEVAHEALLREWDRLRAWIEDERDSLLLRKRLDAAMQEWHEAYEDVAYLLRGSRLNQFDGWAAGTEMALSGEERSFLQASREHDEHLARTATSRRRQVMLALVAAALIAVGFGIYAIGQRNEAADEARTSETARLGGQAGFVVDRDRQMALLMAVETYRRDPGFEGLSALQRVLVDAGPFMGVLGAGTEYVDVHWVVADRLLAATATELHLVDFSSGEVVVLPVQLGGSDIIRASSPAGIAAVLGAGGQNMLVDVSDGSVEAFPSADGSQAIAISDDGTTVALGYPDGSLELVDRRTGAVTASVLANPPRSPDDIALDSGVMLTDAASTQLGGLRTLAFDPQGDRVLAAGGVFLRAWNVADLSPAGPELVHSSGPDDFNLTAAEARWFWFDPTDDDVAVVVGESYLVRWRLSTGERVALETLPVLVEAASDAGDGNALVLVPDGRVLRAGDADAFVLDTQENHVTALAVDDARTRFAVATNDGIVTGSLDGTRLLARAVPIGTSDRPTLSRDGSMLAAGLVSDGLFDLSVEPAARVQFDVDVEIAQFAGSPATFELTHAEHADVLLWTSTFMQMRNAYELGSGEYVGDFWGSFAPAWSDDGTSVALVDRNGSTQIEDVASGSQLYRNSVPIAAADFDSTGGRLLLVAADRSSARRLELGSGAEAQLPEMPGGVVSAGFTPDDETIVVIGGSGSVWALDANTLAVRQELEDADLATASLASPPVITDDGRWLFSNTDGVARLWHLESGRQIGKPLPIAAGGMSWGIADGDLLRVVTPVGGNAMVWNMDMETWVDLACRAAGRNMTQAEWETFGPRDTEHRPTCPES